MSPDLFVIIICFLSLIIGIIVGTQGFKIYNKKRDKRILKNAKEVLEGKRENKIKIDGEEHDATKFRLRDKDNNERLVNLKGGEIQDEKEIGEIIPEVSKEIKDNPIIRKDSGLSREDSGCSGEKKRNPRARGNSRIRRFG